MWAGCKRIFGIGNVEEIGSEEIISYDERSTFLKLMITFMITAILRCRILIGTLE